MKHKIKWPDLFELLCNQSHLAADEGIYVINWPIFVDPATLISSSHSLGRDHHVIVWPDFFKVAPDIIKCQGYIIDWPYFFKIIEEDDATNYSSEEYRYCIEWQSLDSLVSYEPKNSVQYASSERPKEKNTLVTKKLTLVKDFPFEESVKYKGFDEQECSYYDNSDNLTGLQYVSGHYRRLKNGTLVYVRPHKRIRY
ncbi:hypothetical protein L4C54_03730 [Vibrio lamellibrachiae]|uniref:hypothetical protein n=1 Tax=Vibrio lamellibrachiae TaxID=2910253 RepID=UPI003D0E7A01